MTQLNLMQCAALLGVELNQFRKCRPFLTGFPAPVQASENPMGRKYFDRDEVLAWAQSTDVADAISHGMRRYRGCVDDDEATARRLAMGKAFLSGRYDPPHRQTAYAMRRLTARTCKPKTQRIPARSDWALESK